MSADGGKPRGRMRPLDRLPSIRAKLGAVIVFAVAVTIGIMYLTVGFALRQKEESQQFVQLQAQTQSVVAGFSDSGRPPAHQQVLRLLRQYQRRAVIVEVSGVVLYQDFPIPASRSLVLHGQAVHGRTGSLEYYGVPVVRERHIIAAVFLASLFVFIFAKAAFTAEGHSRWTRRITGPNGKWFFGLLFVLWALVFGVGLQLVPHEGASSPYGGLGLIALFTGFFISMGFLWSVIGE